MKQQSKNTSDIAQVDSYIKVTTPSTFIALSVLAILFISVLVWFFFGSVTDKVHLEGVIFPDQGSVSVDLPHAGLVRTVFIHKGDEVRTGQQLALVSIDGSYSLVSAPCDGVVLSYLAEGEQFQPFSSIVNILTREGSQTVSTVVALADFKSSRELKAGQQAQVTPTYDSRERIGYIKGQVNNVVPYPISRREAEDFFENESIVDEIFPESGAVFFVSIDLETQPGDPSSLVWSFNSDEVHDTGVGTYCDIQVKTKSRPLFKYLFENITEKKNAVHLWLD